MARRTGKMAWMGYPPTHPSFRRYATAIGQAAIAWNAFHEALHTMFWDLIGGENFTGIPLYSATWYAIRHDRSQREMVKAVAKRAHEIGDMPDAEYERIEWLMKEADKVAEARDDAVHAPLFSSGRGPGTAPIVSPGSTHGHPRAMNLENRELLADFRWCRDAATTLTVFCLELQMAMGEGSAPGNLPDIPNLPKRTRQVAPAAPPFVKRRR
jgi:hypothetical protein